MSNTSPFSLVQSFLHSTLERLQPPAWLVEEGQHRVVLLLNHVLMQEPEAQRRLARKKGSVIQIRWGLLLLPLRITPAGLADRAAPDARADLVLSLSSQPPWQLVRQLASGHKPSVQIEGDVQLAAEVAWLADNLRWDLEEDLARLVGDAAAHSLIDAGRKCLSVLKAALAGVPPGAPGSVRASS